MFVLKYFVFKYRLINEIKSKAFIDIYLAIK